MYGKGEGLTASDTQALHWYKRAVTDGDPQAPEAYKRLKIKLQ